MSHEGEVTTCATQRHGGCVFELNHLRLSSYFPNWQKISVFLRIRRLWIRNLHSAPELRDVSQTSMNERMHPEDVSQAPSTTQYNARKRVCAYVCPLIDPFLCLRRVHFEGQIMSAMEEAAGVKPEYRITENEEQKSKTGFKLLYCQQRSKNSSTVNL